MNISQPVARTVAAAAQVGRPQPSSMSSVDLCAQSEPAALVPDSIAVAEPVERPPRRAPGSASILVLEEISSGAREIFLADVRRDANTNFAAGPHLASPAAVSACEGEAGQ